MLCLPGPIERLGRARGYLPAGDCPGGSSPILKEIVGLPGDEMELQASVFSVNGLPIDRLPLQDRDSLGHSLNRAPFGTHLVAEGDVWVLGLRRERSWDSRYFGPVPVESILAGVEPLVTLGRSRN